MSDLSRIIYDGQRLHRKMLRNLTIEYIKLAMTTGDISKRKALEQMRQCRRATNDDRAKSKLKLLA